MRSVLFDSLRPHGLKLARLLCPWDFVRQEYRSGLLFPPPGDFPDPGMEPMSLASPALTGQKYSKHRKSSMGNFEDAERQ